MAAPPSLVRLPATSVAGGAALSYDQLAEASPASTCQPFHAILVLGWPGGSPSRSWPVTCMGWAGALKCEPCDDRESPSRPHVHLDNGAWEQWPLAEWDWRMSLPLFHPFSR